MTIRRRLVTLSVVAFVVVLLAAGSGALYLLRNSLINDIDSSLVERRSGLAEITALVPIDLLEAFADRRPQIAGTDVAAFALTPGGEVLGATPSGSPDAPDPLPVLSDTDVERLSAEGPPFTVGRGPDGFRVAAASIRDGEMLLVLARPLDELADTMRSATLILLIVGSSAALMLGGAIWYVIRRELRPLDAMAETADQITEGELSERVPSETSSNEVGRLAGALNSMLGRIEEAVDAKTESEQKMRQFVADASHELRTPLTSIRGYAELYRAGATTSEHVERAFERIEGEATRMGGLVEDLVLLARLDQERPFTKTEVDMAAVARDAIADARTVEPQRPLTIEVGGGDAVVKGDVERLRQVVLNLLGNVRTHTEAGTPASIEVRRDGKWVVVSVADEGPGMDDASAGQAFERFYQANPDRTTPGSGLGLSIVRSIIERHGGTVALDSTPEQGTAVTLRLPAA